MNDAPAIHGISIYPIKALDPVAVLTARILPGGALEHDREFALMDKKGAPINGKRDPRIHAIRATYDLDRFLVTLIMPSAPSQTFHLLDDVHRIEKWFGELLGSPVSLNRNTDTGFPDDLESPGPTILSTGTMREVSSWFNIADIAETRRRFRANIEIATEIPFWEDHLFDIAETAVEFRIGEVAFQGVNPCQRCVVPSRDSSTGAVIHDFQRVFAARREQTLPIWTATSRFNHFYRLAVNTRIPPSEAGKTLRVGDKVLL